MTRKKVVLGVVSLLIIAIVLWAVFFSIGLFKRDEIREGNRIVCEKDAECVKVQTTCCPCNMGGKEACVTSAEAEVIKKSLENCPKDAVCMAMYACNIDFCSCVNGNCTEIRNK